jgi:hypothetical protein
MNTQRALRMAVATLALTGLGSVMAQDQQRAQDRDQIMDRLQDRDGFPGAQLMTQQERNTYMERMRAAQTEQERERVRAEFREKMALRERALNWRDGKSPDASPGVMPRPRMMPAPMNRPRRR